MRRHAWSSKTEQAAESLISVLEPLLDMIEEDELVSEAIAKRAATVGETLIDFRRALNAEQAGR